MTDEELKIARAFVACGQWVWMPGMLTDCGYRLVRRERGAMSGMWRITQHAPERHLDCVDVARHGFIPDITDPCTKGGILQVMANAHGVSINDVHVLRTTGRVWSVWIFRPDDSSYRVATHLPSRVEALLHALQAAPEASNDK